MPPTKAKSTGKSGTTKGTSTRRGTKKETPSTAKKAGVKIGLPPNVKKAPSTVRAAFKSGAADATSLGQAMKKGWANVRKTHKKNPATGKWQKK